jgi:AraC-like DNA-binding protein
MTHHRHAAPYVAIVARGGYVEVSGTMPEFFDEGAVAVHAAGEEHADRFATDTRCLNIELPNDFELADRSERHDRSSVRKAAACVVDAFYRDPRALSAAVPDLQMALQSQPPVTPQHPDWLRRVIDEFEWTEAVPLREAAVLAGLHETHFSRAFRRHMGMTANQYRAQARVRLASQMLLESTTSLSRIAQHAGLADQSHLTRLFSERLGVSPAAYRQSFAR